ncbi:MAG TPA: hypothetical protein VFE25_01085 [Opitutaceae bacterium]|jgi:hypothetical protein|nr:hypothetical protein [Opitutaceae bacterium]
MQSEARAILHELKTKREVRGSAMGWTDYWRTYAIMIVYGVGLEILLPRLSGRGESILVFLATTVVVATSIRDSQRAINRRFEALLALIESKGGPSA